MEQGHFTEEFPGDKRRQVPARSAVLSGHTLTTPRATRNKDGDRTALADDDLTGGRRPAPELGRHDGKLSFRHIGEERHVLQKLLRANREFGRLAGPHSSQVRRQILEHGLRYSLRDHPGTSLLFNGLVLCMENQSLGQTFLR